MTSTDDILKKYGARETLFLGVFGRFACRCSVASLVGDCVAKRDGVRW